MTIAGRPAGESAEVVRLGLCAVVHTPRKTDDEMMNAKMVPTIQRPHGGLISCRDRFDEIFVGLRSNVSTSLLGRSCFLFSTAPFPQALPPKNNA
jgi:hypothetical protein